MEVRSINPEDIRRPVVAGAFYPANAHALASQVDQFLENAKLVAIDGEPVALIAPHAGYIYSGQVAAYVYKQIMGKDFEMVVVIAPSHREYLEGISVYNRGGYETPLGVVEVDVDLANAIIGQHEQIYFTLLGHQEEHSLEVQVPFLQRTLGEFKLVPIVMGGQRYESCVILGDALGETLRNRRALIVASSDLSHFYPYDRAVELDRAVMDSVATFRPEELAERLAAGRCEACGGGPIIAAMLAARNLGADRSRVLMYANSGDVTGDREGVVGYLAAVIYRAGEGGSGRRVGVDMGLADKEKKQLLNIARETIESKVKGERLAEISVPPGVLQEDRGAFVTINKHGMLRGCIGTIVPIKPLYEVVQEMAEAAALRDPRFPPVTEGELDDLEIEISVLTPFRKIDNTEEIEVGKHGIYIKKGYNSGLLLPQVATEYGWDRMTFLRHTCNKAGLPADAWKDRDTEIYIFLADIFGEEEK